MKALKILIGISCFAIVCIAAVAFKWRKEIAAPTNAHNGFAVIELFTSEGCSSCPPADELVARVEKESAGKPVYILAYHVDYWNRLGWKDVFSNAAYSQRQRQYASWLHLESVYTPQIVVNGKTEFVGSEEGNLRNAIKSNLEKNQAAQLTLTDLKADRNNATLQFHTAGAEANTGLLIALVQKSAQTRVTGGENGGHTLSHVQIVRNLQSFKLNKQDAGTESITLPSNFDAEGWELIAFLQNTNTGQIIAATKAAFPPGQTSASLKSSL